MVEQYVAVLLDQETHVETPEHLSLKILYWIQAYEQWPDEGFGADQIAEPENQQAYQNKIMERLNNVDDEVVQFYKLNCPTFNKKITEEL